MIATLFLASIALCAPAAVLATGPAATEHDDPDTVVLTDGDEIHCRVLYEDDAKVIYSQRGKKAKEVPRSDVESTQTIEKSMREFFEQFDRIDKTNPGQIAELALWCESKELYGEARCAWIRVLTVDPENEEAWNKLGGVHSKSRGWRLKVRGRYYTLEQLRERVEDWKNAMELPTAHFLLKTDIQPERALDVAINIERAYQTYYDLLGPHLMLYVFDDVPEVQIYAEAKRYPSPPTPRQAWFSYSANELYVDASGEVNPPEIVSNLTYCLLFNSFRRTLGKTGSIAPWARRGMAEAFGAAVRTRAGKAEWDFDQPYVPYFVAQATDEDPLSMEDVIKAGLASFDSGSKAHRYIAQSYTLMRFLVRAQDGKYLESFAEYLRSSYEGQGSVTHFKKIMGVKKLDELEAEWIAYVKEVAGQ